MCIEYLCIEYFWLLSVQGQFGVIRYISSFWRPCIYFWLKYWGIFVLLSWNITGILLTSKWPSRASRPLGLLLIYLPAGCFNLSNPQLDLRSLLLWTDTFEWYFYHSCIGHKLSSGITVWRSEIICLKSSVPLKVPFLRPLLISVQSYVMSLVLKRCLLLRWNSWNQLTNTGVSPEA